jgi:aminoglycoside/choline kinase family phosphotransferase
VQPLQGQLGGSAAHCPPHRRGQTAIGILYAVREENIAFLEFSRHFRRHGLPVPEIYAEDLSQGAYLEEDLGDTTLFEFLSANRRRRHRSGGRRSLSQGRRSCRVFRSRRAAI